MSPIVFLFCGCVMHVFARVIFNYTALLLSEALLMQASLPDRKDKETAPVAVTWNN